MVSDPEAVVLHCIKTDNILRFDADQPLSQVLPHLSSSHDAAFVFQGNDFIGIISPETLLSKRSVTASTKLRHCVVRPPKLKPSDSLKTAAQAMLDSRIHFLPVVDEREEFVGIITVNRIFDFVTRYRKYLGSDRIIFSNRPLVTIYPGAEVTEARKRMEKAKVAKLPVVNSHGALVGIISQYDLRSMVRQPNSNGRNDRIGEKGNYHDGDLVRDSMTPLVITIDHVPFFSEAKRIMLGNDIGSIVIVDAQNKPMGIVTKKDLLNTLASSLSL